LQSGLEKQEITTIITIIIKKTHIFFCCCSNCATSCFIRSPFSRK